jgi:hypothetical protein
VRGSYDLHVHVAPDVIARRIDDLALARRYAELGLGGFALKSHYVPTAERALTVQQAVPGVDVLGAIVLNSTVGGMNAVAVEIAAREGARIVWLPTFDAVNETAGRRPAPSGTTLPVWAQMQHELRAQGVDTPAVAVTDGTGDPTPETLAVLTSVARHGLVLATGHIGRAEIPTIVHAACDAGVQAVIVTHPDFPSQALSADEQSALLRPGVLLERCFATAHGGRVAWETIFQSIRSTGPENTVLSSDLGQPGNPPVEDGLALFADRLLEAGFTQDEVEVMAVGNTRRFALSEVGSG